MTLSLKNICKSYGGMVAVRDVSLAISATDITGIIGPNGAGKTSLFSLINGLQMADSGSVRLDETDLTGASPSARARSGLAWTFQVPRPFSHLSVRENLYVAARDQPGDSLLRVLFASRKVAAAERTVAERAQKILAFLKLERVQDQPAHGLSGGQKKLMELGRALMLEPRFILLDEPFAGVNPVLIEEIVERITALRAQGIGFLIIEHNIGALSRLVERMIVMDRGQVIADGRPGAVLADERVRLAYLGESV